MKKLGQYEQNLLAWMQMMDIRVSREVVNLDCSVSYIDIDLDEFVEYAVINMRYNEAMIATKLRMKDNNIID